MTMSAETRSNDFFPAIIGFGGAVIGAALLGSVFSPARSKTRRWYSSLKKAPFNPPDAVFAPVWSALYAMIAISGVRVWRAEQSESRATALRLWHLQIILNTAWSPLFFGLKRPGLALLDQGALLPTIVAYARKAGSVDRLAGYLMWPYAAWVAFATLLNAEIVRRNR